MSRRRAPSAPPRAMVPADLEARHRAMSRRRFLGGAGVAVALPFLPSLFRRAERAAAQDDVATRLLAWYVPCGAHMAAWTPTGRDATWSLSPTLRSLAGVKGKVNVLTGLANWPARPDGPGDHASGTGAYLTAAHPKKTAGDDIQNGISVDQVAANTLGELTRFPSLQVGVDGGGASGNCDSGYSCAYARNISWAGPATPLPKVTSPQALFDQLFGGSDPAASATELERRRRHRTSVLDTVLDQAASLRPRLGVSDTRKLDEYMTAVREVETRIEAEGTGPACAVPPRPRNPGDVEARIDLLADLQVLALRCDATRIITFMMGNAGSNRNYGFLPGVSGGHHELSHHQGVTATREQLAVIDRWEMDRFARFLDALDAVEEADGSTLLDNVAILYSGEISDGNRHNHDDMPVVLAGGASGAWATGRHVVYDRERSFGDLYMAMLAAVGVEVERFGDDGTEPLTI